MNSTCACLQKAACFVQCGKTHEFAMHTIAFMWLAGQDSKSRCENTQRTFFIYFFCLLFACNIRNSASICLERVCSSSSGVAILSWIYLFWQRFALEPQFAWINFLITICRKTNLHMWSVLLSEAWLQSAFRSYLSCQIPQSTISAFRLTGGISRMWDFRPLYL